MLFVDREEELSVLEDAYSSGRPELVIVYGRRRMGKTYLLARFARGRRWVYLVVNYAERRAALEDLARQLSYQVELPYTPRVESFTDLYRVLGGLGVRLVVIDEFQRLHGTGGVTELQSSWDGFLGGRGLMLVLSGSSVGMMERIGLSQESPLYGRATRILRVGPMWYRAARMFTPRYGEEDRVRVYAVFGGVPGYLARLDDSLELRENLYRLVFGPGAPLREEPLMLLSMELREPSRYMRILEAIAGGATRLGEIAGKAGVPASELGKYLGVLERELGLVERRYPLGEEGRRGRARYYLADPFTRFWFSQVFPRWNMLERGLHRRALEEAWGEIDLYASHAFEEVALEHFALLARLGRVDASRIGRWWRRDVELDLVALSSDGGTLYVGEVKWTRRPVGRSVLYRLASRAESLPWRPRRTVYVLYSRSGFTFQGGEDVMLFSLSDVASLFEEHRPLVEGRG